MKRTLLGMTGLAVFLALAGTAHAQRNPRGKASLDLGGKSISVDFGRPALHGRKVEEMLSKLPEGEVWRLGADTSTTFSTSGDLKFGDAKVPKGDYSLWARKEAGGKWKLVFNSQHGQWGTDHDPKLDVAEVPLKGSKPASPPEEVTISLVKANTGGTIAIEWGDMKLSTEFN